MIHDHGAADAVVAVAALPVTLIHHVPDAPPHVSVGAYELKLPEWRRVYHEFHVLSIPFLRERYGIPQPFAAVELNASWYDASHVLAVVPTHGAYVITHA